MSINRGSGIVQCAGFNIFRNYALGTRVMPCRGSAGRRNQINKVIAATDWRDYTPLKTMICAIVVFSCFAFG